MIKGVFNRLRSSICVALSRWTKGKIIPEWCRNRPATREEIEVAFRMGRGLADAARSYVAPIFWFDPAQHPLVVLHNGTIFFLNTGERLFAVTAGHVYQKYIDQKAINPAIVCRIGDMVIRPEDRRIDSDNDVDIATFEFSEQEVRQLGKTVLTGSQRYWPPAPPWEGHGVFFCGCPEDAREILEPNQIWFGIHSVNTIATEVSQRIITCEFDRTKWVDHLGQGLPPDGYNLGGISGSPLLTLVDLRPVLTWRLAGVIYQAPRSAREMILARRADFILPDGTVRRFSVREPA